MARRVKASVFKPEARVLYYTEEGVITCRSKVEADNDYHMTNDIISITTNNDLGTDNGTFQIQMVHRHRYDKVIGSNDLVYIQMRRNGEDWNKATVFVGLVDDVRRTVEVQESNIHRTITITGRSLTKIFTNFQIGYVEGFMGENNTAGSYGWFLDFTYDGSHLNFDGQTAQENMQEFLQGALFTRMEYKFSNGKSIADIVDYVFRSRVGESCMNSSNFGMFSGTAWDFMKEITDEPFNQLFFEVYNGKPTLVLRPTPFNQDEWNGLDMYKINDGAVMSNDVGRSDLETYTLFNVNTANTSVQVSGFDFPKPLYYPPYAKKYGTKILRRETKYVSEDLVSALKPYCVDLYNWNCMNARFWNGEITVIGNQHYKVGDRLLYESEEDGRNIEYYIEAVQHSFINMQSWTTKLSVTRGIEENGKQRFASPWGAYEEYEAGVGSIWAKKEVPETDEAEGEGEGNEGGYGDNSGVGGASGSDGIGSFTASRVVAKAKEYLNKNTSYVFGGGRTMMAIQTGVFDCSSFVWHMFTLVGVRNIGTLTSATTDTLATKGKAVSKSERAVGDIVFWHTYKRNGHVGIYIGSNQAIACNTGKGVTVIDMNSSYWKSKESPTIRRLC